MSELGANPKAGRWKWWLSVVLFLATVLTYLEPLLTEKFGVDDAFTATGIGINVPLLFASVFALGVGLAAIGGAAAGPILGLYPGMDIEILIPAFIVVVVGGMGSLRGAFVASVFVGLVDTFGKAYFPDLALFLIYLLMVVVLLTRPNGLFGVGKA